MPLQIRPFQPADAASLDALAVSAFEQFSAHYQNWPAFRARVAQMSALAGSGEILLAELDGELAGAVVYVGPGQAKAAFFQPEWPIMRMLVVAPALRGRGIGRRLAEACLDCARRDGAPLLALHTSPIMLVALPMYLRMGFVRSASTPPIHGVEYAVYVKTLEPLHDSTTAPTATAQPAMPCTIAAATPADAAEVAVLVGALLHEIMQASGQAAFNVDLPATTARLQDFIAQGRYWVFVARDAQGVAAGFITLYEGYALYAEGAFGTIAELYVSPAYRSHGLGQQLLTRARACAQDRGWSRLEVTTPPLPQFARTLAFYEREGFSISGGRKLRALLS